jgi:hypothetical protein
VLLRNGEILPIECKYRHNIRKRDLKGLLKFLTTFDISHGYVISEDIESEEIIEGNKISTIPLYGNGYLISDSKLSSYLNYLVCIYSLPAVFLSLHTVFYSFFIIFWFFLKRFNFSVSLMPFYENHLTECDITT